VRFQTGLNKGSRENLLKFETQKTQKKIQHFPNFTTDSPQTKIKKFVLEFIKKIKESSELTEEPNLLYLLPCSKKSEKSSNLLTIAILNFTEKFQKSWKLKRANMS